MSRPVETLHATSLQGFRDFFKTGVTNPDLGDWWAKMGKLSVKLSKISILPTLPCDHTTQGIRDAALIGILRGAWGFEVGKSLLARHS